MSSAQRVARGATGKTPRGNEQMKKLFLLACVLLLIQVASACQAQVKVLVWDEQQPVKEKVYDNFPGNFIADYLAGKPGFTVKRAKQDDPDQGLSSEALRWADVLVYWGHVRQKSIAESKGQEIAELVKSGELAFIPMHSAHWSVPFMVCMQEKAAADALARLPASLASRATVKFEGTVQWKKAGEFDRNVVHTRYEMTTNGVTVHVQRPNCVFPRCCGPGQPSQVRIIHKKHPICAGLPPTFTLPATEMYDEPFGIPEPDTLLFDENWKGGEYFRSGCLWRLGKGQVFYFRPGDQQYAIYKNPHILKIIENACLWMASAE